MSDLSDTTKLVAAAVDRLDPELREFRRDLHRHPEPSWHEHRTTERITERLAAAGLTPKLAPIGTGVVCDIGGDGPIVALRGDIDALPLLDGKDVPYRSTVAGVSHACGHDVHATTVLGAGLALAEAIDRAGSQGPAGSRGTVRLIFQPAEETVPGGAEPMITGGVMDGCRPSSPCTAIDPRLRSGRLERRPDHLRRRHDRDPPGGSGRSHRPTPSFSRPDPPGRQGRGRSPSQPGPTQRSS